MFTIQSFVCVVVFESRWFCKVNIKKRIVGMSSNVQLYYRAFSYQIETQWLPNSVTWKQTLVWNLDLCHSYNGIMNLEINNFNLHDINMKKMVVHFSGNKIRKNVWDFFKYIEYSNSISLCYWKFLKYSKFLNAQTWEIFP